MLPHAVSYMIMENCHWTLCATNTRRATQAIRRELGFNRMMSKENGTEAAVVNNLDFYA